MIPRYTREEMGRVWSDANRFQKWLDVELAATDTLAAAGLVPKDAAAIIRERAKVDVPRIQIPNGEKFADHFAKSLEALHPLELDRLVDISREAIQLTALGRLFARNVAACFDARSAHDPTKHASAV